MRALKRLARLKSIIDSRAQWLQSHMWLHWRVFREALRARMVAVHPLLLLWGLL